MAVAATTTRTRRTQYQPPPMTEQQFVEWMLCARNPVHFIMSYVYILDPVQGKILFSLYNVQRGAIRSILSGLRSIILKSRQMGATWIMAALCYWMCNFHTNKNVQMISLKKAVAKRFIDRIKFIHDNLPDWLRPRLEEDTKHTIAWLNGSRIDSQPTSEDAGRSEGVSWYILDEAAHLRWINEIWQGLAPSTSTGGMLTMLSTPNGAQGLFHKTWMDSLAGSNNFTPIFMPWWECPMYARGLVKKRITTPDGKVKLKYWSPWYEEQLKTLGWRKTQQEIDCEFLTVGANFFDIELMRARFNFLVANAKFASAWMGELRVYEKPDPTSIYVLGIDTATGHGEDYSTAVVRDFITWDQVAVYQTQIPVNCFAEKVAKLGEMFNFAYVVGEENGVSLATLLQLRDVHHYPNEKIHYEQEVTKRDWERNESRIGWNNNVKSRAVYLRNYEELVRTKPKTFRDARSVSEILSFVIKPNGRPEAMDDHNDDIIFADLGALIGLTHFQPYTSLPFYVR